MKGYEVLAHGFLEHCICGERRARYLLAVCTVADGGAEWLAGDAVVDLTAKTATSSLARA